MFTILKEKLTERPTSFQLVWICHSSGMRRGKVGSCLPDCPHGSVRRIPCRTGASPAMGEDPVLTGLMRASILCLSVVLASGARVVEFTGMLRMQWKPGHAARRLVAMALLLTAGCDQPQEEASGPPRAFIFARGSDAHKLDPADVDDGESVNTIVQIFEGLLAFKESSLEVEPRLAESYSISDDGLRYRFQIRPGIQFHDGVELNAETARFSFIRQMDPEHPAHFKDAGFQYWKNLFADVESIEVRGPMTLEFRLRKPNASLLYAFATFPAMLVSPGAYEQFGDQMPFHPVGTGPYRFKSWRPNEAIVLERHDGYWREPKAGFEQLILRVIPLNTTRLAELQAGTIHGLDGVQPVELKRLRPDPRFRVYEDAGMNVGYLAFNLEEPKLQDPELRRAMALSIDRQAILQLGLDGGGRVAELPIPPGFLGGKTDLAPLEHHPEEARRLVEAHPEWTEHTYIIDTFGQPRNYFPDPQRVASLIKSDLVETGFKVRIVNRDFKSHLHTTRNARHEMALLGWIADTPDTDNFLSTFFHSKAAAMGSATNISFYRNEEMDTLLERALRQNDPAERAEIYGRALELWRRDLPLVPLVHGAQITVLRSEIKGYDLHPSGNHFFGPVRWETEAGEKPVDRQ